MSPLATNVNGLLDAIEGCRRRGEVLPALILIYAGIDIMGSLERSGSKGNRGPFEHWATRYLEPRTRLGCESVDLFDARCAVHRRSPHHPN